MPKLSVPAYVLTNPKRLPLVKPWVKGDGVTYFVNPDWEAPPGLALKPEYGSGCPPLTHYRCFKGHQAMMEKFLATGKPVGLFLEDDAVPNSIDYLEIMNLCAEQFTEYPGLKVFFTYGRDYDRRRFEDAGFKIKGRSVLCVSEETIMAGRLPRGGIVHCFGTLAYLMSREAALEFAHKPFFNEPIDVSIADTFCKGFALLEPSPWNHNRCQGSLIEGTLKRHRAFRRIRGPIKIK